MKFNFSEVFDAFDFVSSSSNFENTAFIDMDTGKIYYHSEITDIDELPEDIDYGNYIELPHRNELDLGKVIVFDFVQEHIPDDFEKVENIFSREGAYSRFKELLDSKGLLEKWYDFEHKRKEEKLRKWCEDNLIQFK